MKPPWKTKNRFFLFKACMKWIIASNESIPFSHLIKIVEVQIKINQIQFKTNEIKLK